MSTGFICDVGYSLDHYFKSRGKCEVCAYRLHRYLADMDDKMEYNQSEEKVKTVDGAAQTSIEADLLGLLPKEKKTYKGYMGYVSFDDARRHGESSGYNAAIQKMAERIRDYCRGKL